MSATKFHTHTNNRKNYSSVGPFINTSKLSFLIISTGYHNRANHKQQPEGLGALLGLTWSNLHLWTKSGQNHLECVLLCDVDTACLTARSLATELPFYMKAWNWIQVQWGEVAIWRSRVIIMLVFTVKLSPGHHVFCNSYWYFWLLKMRPICIFKLSNTNCHVV
jgi:hypothetical protein